MTEDKIATQVIVRQLPSRSRDTRWREVDIYQKDSRPSWRSSGNGSSSARVSAVIGNDGIPVIEITTREIAYADHIQKRDVSKDTSFTAYGEAALEIYEVLREAFEGTRHA